MSNKWKDILYLQQGDSIQKKSFEVLKKVKIFEVLQEFEPILVGTIPLGIYVNKSDLDIICCVHEFERFENLLIEEYGKCDRFQINSTKEVLVCNFFVEEMEIEIYASEQKSTSGAGYRHMLIEHRILELAGKTFHDKIVELKQNGLKTEPAFASLLQLEGNPYDVMLELENKSDEAILEYVRIAAKEL